MQVYVAKADLGSTQPMIYGSYPDLPLPDRNLLGFSYAVLTLGANAIGATRDPISNMTVRKLSADWRNTQVVSVTSGEAYRRIIESFSEFMQRNATNDVLRSNSIYGMDTSSWPADAVARKAEADRGWAYIAQVRQVSDAMSTLPTDPTDDSHWPTRITPIYITPVY